ncbi:hypothetical protein I656_03494 [Geobacillus sp. WSUCF1]|nr:hypothetical protein I656_03494 [Geobacillus sp. WSUCF1]
MACSSIFKITIFILTNVYYTPSLPLCSSQN